jgi:ABC-type multidrug transport system fused ATPase/permease subunit
MELEERNVEDSADKQPIVSTPPKLVINRLAFKYIKKSPWIFKDVDLDILPGEKVAFIGPSGQGKTTLIRILLSLIKPKSGHIQLDTGTDTFDINPETRNYYTYVPQGDTLFTGTIRTNLYLGNPNATDEELYHVLDLVCAKEFIQQMPDQLDTVLGEQGVGLSQGQAQRIAIARALLRGAAIILLDEATSALDIPTEEKILKNIFHAYKDFTIIVISHRDTIMSFVDKSYTLQDSDIIPHT